MKIKIQITVESDDGQLNVAQDVAHLDRGTLRPETLGLTLAEARSILAGIEQTVVEQQAAEFMAQQRSCSHCGHERSCKGRHHIVFRTPFGKLRLESPRLYHCQCESDGRTSFSPLAELLQERSSPELVYLETKFAALVSYGLTVELSGDMRCEGGIAPGFSRSRREAIEGYITDLFQRHQPVDRITKITYVYAFGGDLCALGGWTVTINGSMKFGGFLINVYTQVGGTWKISSSVFKYPTS